MVVVFHLFNDIKTLNITFYCKININISISHKKTVQSIHNIQKNVAKECFQKVLLYKKGGTNAHLHRGIKKTVKE